VQSPVQELATLTSAPDFVADLSGDNGRVAQQAAMAKKSALTRQAHGEPEAPATPLPTQIQEGLDSPDPARRAAAEAMRPGESPDDYSFTWGDASTLDFNDLQNMTAIASEAAHAIGANPQYARSTVSFIEAQLRVNADGPELTPAALDEALADKFGGGDGQAIAEAAAGLIDRMPDAGQKWLTSALRGLDAHSATVVIERLARTASANAPKA
jgi:hypothetical protein